MSPLTWPSSPWISSGWAPGPAAVQFVADYEEETAAPLPESLMHLYVALRAYVRTKVACIRVEQGDSSAAEEAAQLLELARAHLDRGQVRLVLVGGVPGSGKSTLAEALGRAMHAIVVRSDLLRSGQREPVEGDHGSPSFGSGRYSPESTREVYGALLDSARGHLVLGRSVVLDASWVDASHREMARALSTETSSGLIELHCVAPPAVTEGRVAMRRREGRDPSEATVDIARAMARVEAPWPSALTIDTARPPDVVLEEALRSLGVEPDET